MGNLQICILILLMNRKKNLNTYKITNWFKPIKRKKYTLKRNKKSLSNLKIKLKKGSSERRNIKVKKEKYKDILNVKKLRSYFETLKRIKTNRVSKNKLFNMSEP